MILTSRYCVFESIHEHEEYMDVKPYTHLQHMAGHNTGILCIYLQVFYTVKLI